MSHVNILTRGGDVEDVARALVEWVPVPAVVVNGSDRFLAINQRFTAAFGCTTKELVTVEDWFQRAYPDESDRAQMRDRWKNHSNSASGDAKVGRVTRMRTLPGASVDVTIFGSAAGAANVVIVLPNDESQESDPGEVLWSMCMFCKSVRTKDDQWQSIEAQLHQAYRQHCSHGICPSCMPRVLQEM